MPLGNEPIKTWFQELPVGARFWMHPDDGLWLEKTRPETAPTDTGKSNAIRADGLRMYVHGLVVVWQR